MIIQVQRIDAKVGDWVVHYSCDALPNPGDSISVAFNDEELRRYSVIRVNHILTQEGQSRILKHEPVVLVTND